MDIVLIKINLRNNEYIVKSIVDELRKEVSLNGR